MNCLYFLCTGMTYPTSYCHSKFGIYGMHNIRMYVGMHVLMYLIFSNDINTTFTISYVIY